MNKLAGIWFIIAFLIVVFSAFREQLSIFGMGESRGFIQNRELKEASGLTASIKNPGLLWAHNDSGDEARIFLMDDFAKSKAVYYLEKIMAYDWEEIASLQHRNESYLLVGDIGDNKGKLPFIKVHLFKEPLYKSGNFYVDTIRKKDINSYILKYEDGARDAEALFYDQIDQALYIISKRELEVGLYKTSIPFEESHYLQSDTLILKKAATLPYTFITSAAISTDGSEVLIKNLLKVFYWKRTENESIPALLRKRAIQLPYEPEPQGEAITFAQDGSGYYTLSEEPFGIRADLRFYPRLKFSLQ